MESRNGLPMRRFQWITVTAVTAALMGLATGCGSSAEQAPATSGITISGNVTVPAAYMATGLSSYSVDPIHAMIAGTACGDGNYYAVRCMSLGDTVAVGDGIVNCSGTTGGFSISGMPVSEPIGCFIRRSSDGATYTTMGTIEFDAATLSGTNSTLVGTGDLKFDVTVGASGTITAVIDSTTSGNVSSGTVSGDPTALSAFYKLTCKPGVAGEVFDTTICKCNMFADQTAYYQDPNNFPGGYTGAHDACLSDNAANIAANASMFIDMNIYSALASADMVDGTKVIVPAGGTLYGVSVWAATDATTTTRVGGEALPNFGVLTWASAQATNAITWSGNFSANLGAVGVKTVAVGAVPSVSANVGAWQTWIQNMVVSAVGQGWVCNDYQGNPVGAPANDVNCLQRFLWEVYQQGTETATLPRVYGETFCAPDGGGGWTCPSAITHLRVNVEGMYFDYSAAATPQTDVSAYVNNGGVGPSPRNRFVMEQWIPLPGGGGSFGQHNARTDWIRCVSEAAGPHEFQNAACPSRATGDYRSLRCFLGEETKFTFVPSSTGMVGTFETRSVVYGADPAGLNGLAVDPYAICSAAASQNDSVFKIDLARQ